MGPGGGGRALLRCATSGRPPPPLGPEPTVPRALSLDSCHERLQGTLLWEQPRTHGAH